MSLNQMTDKSSSSLQKHSEITEHTWSCICSTRISQAQMYKPVKLHAHEKADTTSASVQ